MAIKGVCDICGEAAELSHYHKTSVRFSVVVSDVQTGAHRRKETCRQCYEKIKVLLDKPQS